MSHARSRRPDGKYGAIRGRVRALLVLLGRRGTRPGPTTSARPTLWSARRQAPTEVPPSSRHPGWASTSPSDPLRAAALRTHLLPTSTRTSSGAGQPLRAEGSFWRPRARRKSRSGAGRSGTSPQPTSFGPRAPGHPPTGASFARANKAVHRADRCATVVLGSLTGVGASHALGPDPSALPERVPKVLRRRVGPLLLGAPVGGWPRSRRLKIAKLLPGDAARARPQTRRSGSPSSPGRPRRASSRAAPARLRDHARGQAARVRPVFPAPRHVTASELGIGRPYRHAWASEYVPRLVPVGPAR